MGKMRRAVRFGVLALVGITLIAADGHESIAIAKYLKNGVRAGDRSLMTIRRRPGRGVRKRIYHPDERKPKVKGGLAARKESYAWFWKIHSAAASAASPDRFSAALATMAGRRAAGKGLIGATALDKIAETYRTEISAAARTHRVSEALILAVITVESRGSAKAISPKGAQGLMQLIPATAKRFGVSDPFDAGQNIDGGAAYLSWLLKTFRGDPLLALAGYNAGEGAVQKHDGVPPYAETRDYIVLVMDALTAAQKLCATPIAGPRQRCHRRPASS
jgi:soluble lytic murein transglycosylase-like protein